MVLYMYKACTLLMDELCRFWDRPLGFGKEDFFTVFNVFLQVLFILTNLNFLHLRILCAKLNWIGHVVLEKSQFKVIVLFQIQICPVVLENGRQCRWKRKADKFLSENLTWVFKKESVIFHFRFSLSELKATAYDCTEASWCQVMKYFILRPLLD